jgi:hypothetical protein
MLLLQIAVQVALAVTKVARADISHPLQLLLSCKLTCIASMQSVPYLPLQIAVQVALVVAKVARFDFPSQWPTLFNDLLAGLQAASGTAAAAAAAGGAAAPAGPSMLMVRRTYFVLHHVLKELSSKRLAADQRAFAEVSLQERRQHSYSSFSSSSSSKRLAADGIVYARVGLQDQQPLHCTCCATAARKPATYMPWLSCRIAAAPGHAAIAPVRLLPVFSLQVT